MGADYNARCYGFDNCNTGLSRLSGVVDDADSPSSQVTQMMPTLTLAPHVTRPGLSLSCAVCFLALAVASTQAQTFTPTKHSEYQAVYDDGTSAWLESWQNPYPIQLTGVVINNPWDMLDFSNSATSPAWQVYIQAIASDDFGGTALYMRKITPWSESYNDEQWTAEMQRLNNPVGSSSPLKRGDVVRVNARAPGLFYGGKYNVNEKHLTGAAYDFDIEVIGSATPDVTSLLLSDLKDSSDNFIFDSSRATGCERYQGSLVQLDNLLLVDSSAWGRNGTVKVKQGSLTFDMKLGLDPALDFINASALQTTPFSVKAILDQEDGGFPHTDNYRLWLTNADDLEMVPEASSLALWVIGAAALGIATLRRRRHPEAR